MLPKVNTSPPVRNLLPGNEQKAHGDKHHRDSSNCCTESQVIRKIREAPNHDDKESDQGQISIAISYDLITHLYDTDDGHRHSEEPGPSESHIGAATAQFPGHNSDRYQEDSID